MILKKQLFKVLKNQEKLLIKNKNHVKICLVIQINFKDIQNYNQSEYTIEAGIGENPLLLSQFDKIYNDNIGILLLSVVL